VIGETDDLGWGVVKDPVHVHDLHATILHSSAIDHEGPHLPLQGRDSGSRTLREGCEAPSRNSRHDSLGATKSLPSRVSGNTENRNGEAIDQRALRRPPNSPRRGTICDQWGAIRECGGSTTMAQFMRCSLPAAGG